MTIQKINNFLLVLLIWCLAKDSAWAETVGSRITVESGVTHEDITKETFSELSYTTNGGAIYNQGSIGSVEDSTFTSNSAYYGGAIYNYGGTIDIISGSEFTSNTGTWVGGAISNTGTITKITGSKFSGNEGMGNAGAIYNTGTIVEISGSEFTGNTGGDNGGAIYNYGGSIGSIKGSTFTSNTADYASGGAIYNTGSIGEISDSSFTENKTTSSGKSGGAIYNTGTITSISGTIQNDGTSTSSFTSNESANGGAIYNSGTIGTETNGTVTGGITNTVFEKNSATTNGGAIYNDSTGKIGEISGNIFTENKTTSTSTSTSGWGAAIYNDGTITEISNNTFSENSGGEGTVYNGGSGTISIISGNTFTENSVSDGGGIYNNANIGEISGNMFTENTASNDGGAILNYGTITTITNNSFTSNTVTSTYGGGGAIYNYGTIESLESSSFTSNTSTGSYATGGAILNTSKINTITSCTFESNTAATNGGAIDNYTGTIGTISGSTFKGNSATNYGGAIDNDSTYGVSTITSIDDTIFSSNTAGLFGGAICNWSTYGATIGEISGCTFTENSVTGGSGGAIFNHNTSTIGEISGSTFSGNTVSSNGGAIENRGTIGSTEDGNNVTGISGCTFSGNTAGGSGGAIYNSGTIATIKNTSFYNNSASGNGGAIYSTTDLTIAADGSQDGGNVVFSGNTANGKGDAIYMANASGTIYFELSNDGSIYLYDSVSGAEGYGVEISGDGTFYLLSELDGAALSIGNTASPYSSDTEALILNTVDGSIVANNVYSLTITSDVSMFVDVDLAKQTIDRFTTTATENNYSVTDGCTLTVSGMNLISDATSDSIAIYFAEPGLMEYVSASTGDLPDGSQMTAYAPVYTYNVYYVYLDGVEGEQKIYDANGNEYCVSDSTLFSSDDASGGYFVFNRNGNNPAVMASSVAGMAAAGAMNLMFNANFEHSDYFMKLPEEVRLAKAEAAKAQKSAAKIKENDPRRSAYYNQNEMTERGAWFKSFYANENVSYRGGWDSRDKYYGALVGFDTDMHVSENGWASVFTGYVGTIGIRQSYSGGHIKQHGGLIGATGSFYRKNFYTAWTAAAGFTKADEHTMYGHDRSKNDLWGVAGKFGWNFEFGNGKFSLLPTFTASYSTVDPEDYTTAADVKISGGMRAVQLSPNLKLIMNAPRGLQPYVTVGEVWTVGHSSSIKANGEKLPELDLKAYTEYGIGVQKRWADEKDAYIQLLGHSDGRDGILVNAGLRWNF